jgi:hypothetical protein
VRFKTVSFLATEETTWSLNGKPFISEYGDGMEAARSIKTVHFVLLQYA